MFAATLTRRLAVTVAATSVALAGLSIPADAQDALPSCGTFDVGLTILDAHGNPVTGAAGTTLIELTNESTGASTTARIAGTVIGAVTQPDGSTTYTFVGRSFQALFPTDPGGPSTTVYSGILVFNQAADGTTTILSSTGSSVDLCAVLAG